MVWRGSSKSPSPPTFFPLPIAPTLFTLPITLTPTLFTLRMALTPHPLHPAHRPFILMHTYCGLTHRCGQHHLRLWPQSVCPWWNPSRRKHTHTHCPLNHPITCSETPVSYTCWSSVTNKRSLETDRLPGSFDLLSGVSILSPSPLTLITFPFLSSIFLHPFFSPSSFLPLFLSSSSLSSSLLSSLSLYSKVGGKRLWPFTTH